MHKNRLYFFILCSISCLLLCETANAERPIPDDPYNILKEIPSFYDLFAQKNLSSYSTDVKIEGAITKSLLNLAADKNLLPPEFIEYYTQKEGFKFRIKNKNYPVLLKQVVGEMFTPVHIFDRVISLIESKRELTWFEHFKSVTKVDAKWVQYQESPHIKLVFTSKLDNPIEKREEINGPSKKTIITNSMTFIIEPSSKMIKVLKVDQVEKNDINENKIEKKFIFEYISIGTHFLPSELRIEKNNIQEVKLKAVYTTVQGFNVYSEKIFEYTGSSGALETVKMYYSSYRFNENVDFSYIEDSRGKSSSLANEMEAEKLYNKAKDLIINGKTSEATKLLKKIIKDFSNTSYSEQAKTLLSGLSE